MSDSIALAIKPIVRYPRVAQVGKTYLMTIDLEVEPGAEWNYEEEEYPVYCTVDSELFKTQIIGEPVIMLHRFGGSYGEAKILLTTVSNEQVKGKIAILLTNKWGLEFKKLELTEIQVKSRTKLAEVLDISQDILFEESNIVLTENIKQEAINPFLKTLGKLYKSLQGESRRFEDNYLKCQASDCQDFITEVEPIKEGVFALSLEEMFLPLQLDPKLIVSDFSRVTLEDEINNTLSIWHFLGAGRTDSTVRQIMILAWGGYGKTTLLRHITRG
jgi:predicted NACHT family NTPase